MIVLMGSNEEITTTYYYYVPIFFVWKSFLLILFCKVYTIMWTQYKYAINHYERKDTTVSSLWFQTENKQTHYDDQVEMKSVYLSNLQSVL